MLNQHISAIDKDSRW